MANSAKQGICEMELAGYARNISNNYGIEVRYANNGDGIAFLSGCKIEVPKEVNGKNFTTFMTVSAFDDVAESLMHITDGDWLHVRGYYQNKKNEKDGKYYPQVVIQEIIES